MQTKDYRVEVKVKNNWLLKKIEEAGYDSVNQFSVQNKLPPSRVGEFVNLKETPINDKGKWRYHFVKIADALKCLPEDICPPQHLKQALKKNKASFEATVGDVAGFLTGAASDATPAIDYMIRDEAAKTVSDCLTKLTPREERVIRMRFGLTPDGEEHTLRECAEFFDRSVDRIRQIEAKALRKMKCAYENGIGEESRKELRQTAEALGIYPWFPKGRIRLPHYVPEWRRQEEEERERQFLEARYVAGYYPKRS